MDAGDTRFTPQMVIAQATAQLGVPVEQLHLAPVVVLTWSTRVHRSAGEATAARRSEYWIYRKQHDLYTSDLGDRSDELLRE